MAVLYTLFEWGSYDRWDLRLSPVDFQAPPVVELYQTNSWTSGFCRRQWNNRSCRFPERRVWSLLLISKNTKCAWAPHSSSSLALALFTLIFIESAAFTGWPATNCVSQCTLLRLRAPCHDSLRLCGSPKFSLFILEPPSSPPSSHPRQSSPPPFWFPRRDRVPPQTAANTIISRLMSRTQRRDLGRAVTKLWPSTPQKTGRGIDLTCHRIYYVATNKSKV